jgi:citrate synthase
MLAQDSLDPTLYDTYGVKRGLRDKSGKGVVAGLTGISTVLGKKVVDGKEIPCQGELRYRGYSIFALVRGESILQHRLAEECAYLLLFGELPNAPELQEFSETLAQGRTLPQNFTRDVIMKAPSGDVMNSLIRSILTLSSYDPNALDTSLPNVLRQSLQLISTMPMLAVYGYHAYNHYCRDGSFYIHHPSEQLTMAENLLMMLRPDKQFTALEAKVLDLALVLHMEHGGGNNSAFTTHVVTSAGSDTYSVIAAALCSLKGPKHGGANLKVVGMMEDLKASVTDTADREAVSDYLEKALHGEAFDHSGLIYGMGHAVYSLSDPRAVVFKSFVEQLAREKGRQEEYQLYALVEQLAPEIICKERKIYKGVCANVDFYSGFVYSMLDIPKELFTPIFAVARIVGWSAHRMEELINTDKIIRPAYQSVAPDRTYIPISQR